jgi:hypothetical protein
MNHGIVPNELGVKQAEKDSGFENFTHPFMT